MISTTAEHKQEGNRTAKDWAWIPPYFCCIWTSCCCCCCGPWPWDLAVSWVSQDSSSAANFKGIRERIIYEDSWLYARNFLKSKNLNVPQTNHDTGNTFLKFRFPRGNCLHIALEFGQITFVVINVTHGMWDWRFVCCLRDDRNCSDQKRFATIYSFIFDRVVGEWRRGSFSFFGGFSCR